MITKYKLFEYNIPFKSKKFITEYQEGDFVLLNLDEIKNNLDEWSDLPTDISAKIIYIDNDDSYDVQIFNSDKHEGYNVKLSVTPSAR